MVKKKAPFIPVTIIVIGVGFVFAMNARSRPVDPEVEAKRQQAEASQQAHPKDNPDVMTAQIHNAVQTPKVIVNPAKKGIGRPPTGPDDLDPMRVTRQAKYKPTYNPTTAEAHWYDKK